MAMQTWETLINAYQFSGTNKGTALKESTTLTDISPGANTAGQALTIPASYLQPGNILRYTAVGIFGTTGKPALKMGLYYGGVAGTALAETIEVTCPETVTTQSWMLEAITRVSEVGTSGKCFTQGVARGIEAVSLATQTASTTMMPETTATGGEATIDTSVAKIITVGAKWGTSNAANTITCYQWLVEILN